MQKGTVKSESALKHTVVWTLWASFGLLALILAATVLVYYWQVQRIEAAAGKVVQVQELLETAVRGVRVSASDAALAVSDYIRNGDRASVAKARDAEASFDRAARDFAGILQADGADRLLEEMARLREELKGAASEIVTLVDQQQATLVLFNRNIRDIRELTNQIVRATLSRTPPDAMKKLEAASGLQDTLDGLSVAVQTYVANPDPGLLQQITEAQKNFNFYAAAYRQTPLSEYEDGWLKHIALEFEETAGLGIQILEIADSLHGLTDRFETSISGINGLLDNEVWPLIQAQADDASAVMQASVASAGRWLIALVVIGVLTGTIAVLVLSGSMAKPLRDLMEGAKIVSRGKLEHRFNIDAAGEFGQLAFALNQMLEGLGRSREALSESEERAWALLDATTDAVILADLRGVVLASNEVAAERSGKSLEQMVEASLYDILPANAATALKSNIAEVARSRKPVRSEYEREGKIIDQYIYPVFDGTGEIARIAIFARDITVRKWVEEVTEQTGRRNQLILEAAGEGIYGLDVQGKTTFVNPAAARMLGFRPDDLIGQRHHELVHHSRPDGKPYPHEQCPIYMAFKDGAIHSNVDDEVFWRKDGTSFPVEYTSTPIVEDGRVTGAVVTFRDITERKRMENAVIQSAGKQRAILEAGASMLVTLDSRGIVVDCDARTQQTLGYALSDVVGRWLVEMVHPDDRTRVQECLKEASAKGFAYLNRCRMARRDGSFIDVSINAAAVKDDGGAYVRTVCMINSAAQES